MGDCDVCLRILFSGMFFVMVSAIVTTCIYANEMSWYNTQVEATCNDDLSSGRQSALAKVTFDSRRRRRIGSYNDYTCAFNVDAVTTSTQTRYSNLYRYAVDVYTGLKANYANDRARVESMCLQNYVRDGLYGCFIQDGNTDIRFNRTGYPLGVLIGMCISWSILGLGSLFCCLTFIWVSLPSSIVIPTFPTVSLKAAPDVIGSLDQTASEVYNMVAFKKADEGQFRKVIPEDLCDELIPGLMLRVQWPSCGGSFSRWYSATAISYNLTLQTITFKYDHMAIPFSKTTRAISFGQVRFHESALSQVAKRRIIKHAIEGSIFAGLTFPQLDTDGNGLLDPSEVSAGLNKHGIYLDYSTLESLLKLLDQDENGKVDAAEFKKFLTKM